MMSGRYSDQVHVILGIPVVFERDCPRIADARGFWPMKKRIVVGPEWMKLPWGERMAVLYHEAAHCLGLHMEKRLAMLPMLLLAPEFTRRWCRRQEIEADRFAAANGFGQHLAGLLQRSREMQSMFYPSYAERIAQLTGGGT